MVIYVIMFVGIILFGGLFFGVICVYFGVCVGMVVVGVLVLVVVGVLLLVCWFVDC